MRVAFCTISFMVIVEHINLSAWNWSLRFAITTRMSAMLVQWRDVNDSNRDETFFLKLCVYRALTVCVSARVCCQIKWNESLLKHFNDTKDTERRSGTKTKQIYVADILILFIVVSLKVDSKSAQFLTILTD